jgi:pathogenesis-related protein 1
MVRPPHRTGQPRHFCTLALLAASGCASQPPVRPPDPAAAARGLPARDASAITAYHNKVRADVGVSALEWSGELAALAQQWTEQLARSGCALRHRRPNAYGENLFQGTLGAYTALDAARAWESEKKDYAGSALTQADAPRVGHYTQMVWRQTQRLGCGQAVCADTLIVACNYAPPGNVLGRKPY